MVNDWLFFIEYVLRCKDKSQVWVWEWGWGVVDENGDIVFEGVVLDIFDCKELEWELVEMVIWDLLIGFLNWCELFCLLEEELEWVKCY